MLPDQVGGVAVVQVGVGDAQAAAQRPHPCLQAAGLRRGDPPHVGSALLRRRCCLQRQAGFPASAHPVQQPHPWARGSEVGQDLAPAPQGQALSSNCPAGGSIDTAVSGGLPLSVR